MSFLLRSTKPYCLGIAIDRERWEINQLDIILNFQSHIMDAVTKNINVRFTKTSKFIFLVILR